MDSHRQAETESQRLDTSDDDHFSDASEGAEQHEPLPTLRVEKVDDELRHGEVPGTPEYDMRTQDAAPDEVEVIPEINRAVDPNITDAVQSNAQGSPVPMTIVEKVDVNEQSHGEVPGTAAADLRRADAAPDLVREAPASSSEDFTESPTSPSYRSNNNTIPASTVVDGATPDQEPGDGGDDFDDFELGSDDDDFGAFDDGDDEAASATPNIERFRQTELEDSANLMQILNFDRLETLEDITAACTPILNQLYPNSTYNQDAVQEPLPEINASFLTERSQSLWEQLVALPPLQPPDWIRSRIRRLFLVSLGVPVDLDEILPASKQKKLILPSTDVGGERSSLQDTETRTNGGAGTKHAKSSSNATQPSASKGERRKKVANATLNFDLNSARLLSSTTEAALSNFTDSELKEHFAALQALQEQANKSLEYWVVQKDSALGDKAAFEEVIENLVKHAKKIRK